MQTMAVILLAVAASMAITPQRPAEPRAQQMPTFKVQSKLVVVDATVRNKKGEPVTDLRQEDFAVYEDNVLQEIVNFSLEQVPAVQPAAVPEAAAPELLEKKIKPAIVNFSTIPPQQDVRPLLEDKRLVILFFDLSSMESEDLMRSVTAARKFIAEQATEHDLLALATYDYSLDLIQDLTNDKDVVLKLLNSLITVGEGEAAEDPEEAESSDEVFVPDSIQFNIFNTDRRLAALETISKMYREFPERKSLIYFSSGFQTTGSENDSQIRSTVDTANQSNLTIYAADSRGLVALPPGGAASAASRGGGSLFTGGGARQQLSRLASSQETLHTLSHDTGGTVFQDTNDIGEVFQRVWHDTQAYYVLGYFSTNSKDDGKYRRVRVEIRRPDIKITHRPGYFAAKSFRQMTETERDRQLEEALKLELHFTEVPLILQADCFMRDGKTSAVPLSIQIAGQGLEFEDKGKQRQASFEFLAQVADPQGKVAGVMRDQVDVRLPVQTASRIQAGQILYTTQFQLRPGDYRLKVLVRDNRTGKIGSFEQPLQVAALEGKKLEISSIILGSRLVGAAEDSSLVDHRRQFMPRGPGGGPPGDMRGPGGGRAGEMRRPGGGAPADPMTIGDKRIVPSIGNVFLSRQNLYAYFQVYGAAKDPQSGRPFLQSSVMLLDGATRVFESKPQQVQDWIQGRDDAAAVSLSLPLRDLKKGIYTLQVHLRDVISDTNLFRRIPFVVE